MSDAPQDAGSNALHIQMRRLGGSTVTAMGLKNAEIRDGHPMGAQVDHVDPTG